MEPSAIGESGTDLISLVEEMRAAMLERLDGNRDGVIDKTEVGAISELFGEKVSGLISRGDANRDGVLDEAEVMGMLESTGDGLGDKIRQMIFAFLDRNGDGVIDETDVDEAIEAIDEEVSETFDAYDANRDGALDGDEIGQMLRELLPDIPPPPPPGEHAEEPGEPAGLDANALLALLNEQETDDAFETGAISTGE